MESNKEERNVMCTTKEIIGKFTLFEEKMRSEKLPQLVLDTFKYYYLKLAKGETGYIYSKDILPLVPSDVPSADQELQTYDKEGASVLGKTAVIKLNGGLGTSMGLDKAKSLIVVKDGFSFLDISIKKTFFLREKYGVEIPIILMNSFNTDTDTIEHLKKYPGIQIHDIPVRFLQHKYPKVLQETLEPARYPENPRLEWNPPGHGDIYSALVTSGILERLLRRGFQYAMLSNADNLGAVLDTCILGYFAKKNVSFMMEVADRTEMDKKGGFPVKTKSGKLILWETAQCPSDEIDMYIDTNTHHYFNANNLWINLKKLNDILKKKGNILGLPLIRNTKTVNPKDKTTAKVFQIETAMGAAIAVFEDSATVKVSRKRFVPVKKCDELLILLSDYFKLTNEFDIIKNPERSHETIMAQLDEKYFGQIEDFLKRFENGVPSLVQCEKLKISGDVRFGRNICIRGKVEIINQGETPYYIKNNTIIDKNITINDA